MFVSLVISMPLFLASSERSPSSRQSTRASSTSKVTLSGQRLKWLSELREPNLGDLIGTPQIQLPELFLIADEWPKDLKAHESFKSIEELFELLKEKQFEKAYVQSDRLLSKIGQSNQKEWLTLLKADIYFQQQSLREKPQWSLMLQEYQDFARNYPLNSEMPRVLYQTALVQLKMGFSKDVEETVNRALRDFPATRFEPYYRLLLGEQAFIAKDYRTANFEFSFVIQKFPNHSTSLDSAFRKALIIFRERRFPEALQVYEDLARLHSDQYERLRKGRASQTQDKYLDRLFYAEAQYQNFRYKEAARLFQDLANIFPSSDESPLLLLRLADTYLRRNKVNAALSLYKDVLDRYSQSATSTILAHLRLADAYFLTDAFRSQSFSEDHYMKAYEVATQAKNDSLASLALAKLGAFHFFQKTYPKAQAVFRLYRKDFKESENHDWVNRHFAKTIEIEIFDYYQREDYLAALSTYLSLERDDPDFLKDTSVLLNLANSARRLGLLDKATSILNRIVYLDKTTSGRQEALLELVDLTIVKGELRKASERLRRFRFAYPKSRYESRVDELWGDLYARLKNREGAIGHYQAALKTAKKSESDSFDKRFIRLRLAELYQEEKLPLRAIEELNAYLNIVREKKKNPLSPGNLLKKDDYLYRAARYRIADMHFNMGDYVRALESYSKVVEEIKDEPFQSHALYRMGECYLALDDREAAIKVFQTLVKKETPSIWTVAAKSFIETVSMEVKYGIRIIN